MDKGEKIFLEIVIIVLVLLLIGVFFIGRECGIHDAIYESDKWILDFEKPNDEYDFEIVFVIGNKFYKSYGYIG